MRQEGNFLRKTATYTGAGIVASTIPIHAKAYVAGTGEINVALVGCGGRGTGAAAQAIQADADVKLVAMADSVDNQLQNSFKGLSMKFANFGQIKVTQETIFSGFDAYKKAIDLADVVILATPPGFRPLCFENHPREAYFYGKAFGHRRDRCKKNFNCW